MSNSQSDLSEFQWYAVQTLSNQEAKVKRYLDKFITIEEMGEFIDEVLMPTEKVSEVKNGKKQTKDRKLYPSYVFIRMRLYDETHTIRQKPWYFIRGIQGLIGFVGGDRPNPLKEEEISRIKDQVTSGEARPKLKVEYEVGESVKINDGPFLSLSGLIEEIDPERGKLKVSVSIFGRFTPVELEYWQVERAEES